MNPAAMLIAAAFDLILGDPRWLPHPVRWIGSLIAWLEEMLYPAKRSARAEFVRGMILCCCVVCATVAAAALFLTLCRRLSPVVAMAGEVIVGFYCLSARSLVHEATIVRKHLEAGDVPEARAALSMIVGRDTACLEEKDIVRATIETVAENITDGIVSPLLYLAVGGPLAAVAFKAVSTMDSMIGYKDDRYRRFGTFAARLDDALNFIPARISGFALIPLAAFVCRLDWKNAVRIVARDRLKHESPNAAHGEAALAGALSIRLGGGAWYEGEWCGRPYLGDDRRAVEVRDIGRAGRIALVTACVTVVLACAAAAGIRR